MIGDDAPSRAAMFDASNRVAFDRPVDEAARAWWIARFFEPHGLTPEGMGRALTNSLPHDKHTRYRFIDGEGEAFCLRVEGSFAEDGEVWFVERTLSLGGGVFDADEMFVPSSSQGRGHGRRLMLDLIDLSETLGIDRVKVQARRVGRYAWLRMGFKPDAGSWRDMRGALVSELFRLEPQIGREKVAGLVRQIATGPPDTAGVLAALTDPVPSRLLKERSRPVIVPLGKALFLDTVGDWSGEFDLHSPDDLILARAYAETGQDDR